VPVLPKVNEVFEELASCTRIETAGHVRYGTLVPLTPETLAKIVAEPGCCAVKTPVPVSAVMTLAVPLQVADPLLKVAVVGGVLAP